jgi:putative oxidoreductase
MSPAVLLVVIGRFLLGGYFAQAAVRNFLKFSFHREILAGKRLPFPREGLVVALTVQLLGGLMVALGIYPAIGAIGLIAFTIVANILYHGFWNFKGTERTGHLNSVLTNLGMIGGLLLVTAVSS